VNNGEKIRFSLKDIEADIRSRDQTYGLMTGRTVHRDSTDVQSVMTQRTYS
jgi:hypothetical protein